VVADRQQRLGFVRRLRHAQRDQVRVRGPQPARLGAPVTRRIEAGVASVELDTLFTDDVVGWSPYATVSGLTALAALSALREVAFSDVLIMFRGLDEVGNKAFAEWLIEADHTGPYVLGEDAVLEATGRHVPLAGFTVADFREGKIRSFRTYFDDVSLIEQIVGA
jgi:ketosteroid isomerase-like protein